MLVRIPYYQVENTALKGVSKGKTVNMFMIVQVDESNVIEAISNLGKSKGVAALEYDGDTAILADQDLTDVVILTTRPIDAVDMNLDFIRSQVDERVRIVFKLPDNYSDMKMISQYSQKYTNISFTGGHLLRLEGCKIGHIWQGDIPKKVNENHIPLVSQGNDSIMKIIPFEEVEGVEFYEASKLVVTKKPSGVKKEKAAKSSAPKRKKNLSTLVAITSSLDNF